MAYRLRSLLAVAALVGGVMGLAGVRLASASPEQPGEYVEVAAEPHEAFVLPQRGPACYDSLLETYSVPELVKSRVKTGRTSLAHAARASASIIVDIPIRGATPRAGRADPRQERD